MPGEYKKLPNHVLQPDGSIHKYIDPIRVSEEMEALIEWVNNQIYTRDPVIVALLHIIILFAFTHLMTEMVVVLGY